MFVMPLPWPHVEANKDNTFRTTKKRNIDRVRARAPACDLSLIQRQRRSLGATKLFYFREARTAKGIRQERSCDDVLATESSKLVFVPIVPATISEIEHISKWHPLPCIVDRNDS